MVWRRLYILALPLLALFWATAGVTELSTYKLAGLGAYGFPFDPTSLWGVYDPIVELGGDYYMCAPDAICEYVAGAWFD